MAEKYTVVVDTLDFASAANRISGYPGGLVTNIQNNDMKSSGGNANYAAANNVRVLYRYNSATAPVANSAVEATAANGAANKLTAVVLRLKSSTEYYYGRHTNGVVTIWRGTSQVASAALEGDAGLLHMEAEDDVPSAAKSRITLYVNGAEICHYDDASPIGYGGTYYHGFGGSTTATGPTLDDLKTLIAPVDYPTNVAASDGTYKTKVVVTYTPNGSANPTSWYRSLTNDSAAAVLVASGVTGGTYNDYPPESGPAHKYYYFGKSELGGGALSAFSTGDVGWRDSGDPCPADAVTDLGSYMSATLDEDHNITLVDASDPNLDLDVLGLAGIEIEASGTLTFDSSTIAPVITVELWGVFLK